ncbi:TetR family transcriptional regulator [Afipia sp. P52-10]|jgi:AcrR family transcriptional regulator|uniref:TetR/AcrR family transcriptional regulator n=1 Tax=Afipia sp. P52-10 TaxID=1429916 RepID=UPI0003DEFCC3|nr:TetR/AcrR family transcriptional regulator [Afipia sp. P52-10]ETR77533.1 TetR family transcriptional regulator [Afipia sp. P52-10]
MAATARPASSKRPESRRRILPAEVRIDDLMAAAADLFIARGVEATTVDDIVAKAGVAKGTFYHYFKTKSDVIAALRERFAQDFVERVASVIEPCAATDHPARLTAWIRGAVETYLHNYQLHDVVFHDFTHSQRRSREKSIVIAQLEALLMAGERDGAWRFPHARAAATIIFDGMHGVVDDAIAAGLRDPEPLCGPLVDMFTRMLSPSSQQDSG